MKMIEERLIIKMPKVNDLTNQIFGDWKVISKSPNRSKDKHVQWICECQKCGTVKEVRGTYLRNGRSTGCGCGRTQKLRESHIIDITGNEYGFLKVNRRATNKEIQEAGYNPDKRIYWNCLCLKCGNDNVIVPTAYLRDGIVKSCGCLKSYNEALIKRLLTYHNIKFKTEYQVLEIEGSKRQHPRFDFAVLNDNGEVKYFIEYDGQQHFIDPRKTPEHFANNHNNDLLKNKYCFDNKIPLIRIPYDKEYVLEDLFIDTTKFLFTPENEKEYYESRGLDFGTIY